MSHVTKISFRQMALCLLPWTICLLGCGQEDPVVGIKFPDLPPTTLVEGPGFTVEVWEKWTARVEGSKLIISTPDEKEPTIGVVELLPYGTGEDSSTVLDLAETAKVDLKLKNADHRRMNLGGFNAYCVRYARLKKTAVLDTSYYMVAAPQRKIEAVFESASGERLIRDVVLYEKIVASVKLK